MAEVNDINIWGLIIDTGKVVFNWIGAIITTLLMIIIGITRKDFKLWLSEHNEMLIYFRDKTSNSAKKLEIKEERDWEDVIELLRELQEQNKKIQHDVNGARQDTRNLQIFLKAKGLID